MKIENLAEMEKHFLVLQEEAQRPVQPFALIRLPLCWAALLRGLLTYSLWCESQFDSGWNLLFHQSNLSIKYKNMHRSTLWTGCVLINDQQFNPVMLVVQNMKEDNQSTSFTNLGQSLPIQQALISAKSLCVGAVCTSSNCTTPVI